MEAFQANCPRCHTKAAGFTVIHSFCADEGTGERLPLWDVFASCNVCRRAIVASFYADEMPSEASAGDLPLSAEIAPEPADTGAPAHTPTPIDRYFTQGRSSLQAGNYDAAGAMYRKALETALKKAFPEHDDERTLYTHIEAAKDNGGLTKELAEWAHEIRGLGNEATHEEEPFPQDDAQMLDQFTELMLTYLFTLPGKLKEARPAPANES